MPNPHNYKISRDSVPKKGTWKRMTKEKNANSKGEKSLGVEGKRSLFDCFEGSNTLDQASQFEAAEVAWQPC